MQEEDIIDAEFEEQPPTNVGTPGHVDHAADTKKVKFSKSTMLKALKQAVVNKEVSLADARKMRESMGLFNSSFRKKVATKEARKTRRKMQRNSRKRSRR